MSRFMVGGTLFLLIGDHHAATFNTHQHLVLGAVKVTRFGNGFIQARCQQGRFINQVGQVGAGETGRTTGDQRQINLR